jgi:anaerobic magnesium-protoporphyrin IX monomethyl ester cyclase
MHIVLFYPRGKRHNPDSKDIGHLAACLPPLGLLSIAAVLKKAGHSVRLFDAALDTQIPNEVWAKNIINEKPGFVGFSANTPAFNDAYDVCRRIKAARPSIKTVFGGVHVSWGRKRILDQFDAIDYVIAGEGEQSFLQLVNGNSPAAIPGLFSREINSSDSSPLQTRADLADLDTLPFPAYELLPGFPRRYYLPLFGYRTSPGTHIISSRGCVYQCSYCDRSVFGKTFRWNSPRYTFELAKKLRIDFGIRHLYFYDDLFTLNRERVAALCGLLRSAKLGIRFNCIVRIGHIDSDLIAMLKSAGCWMVNVGIESGDQKILDANKEGITLEAVRRDVGALHKAGIFVKGLFMTGFPGETEESIRKTIDFACSLPLKDANVTAFTPYPGAPIAERIHELGAFEENWDNMDCTKFVFVPKEIGDRQLLERLYSEFIRRFYERPFARSMYQRMLFESPHSYWRLVKNLPSFLSYRKRMAA